MKIIDLTGNKFGRLKVINSAGSAPTGVIWLCECECGNFRKVLSGDLRRGKTVSCGCGRRGRNSIHFSGFEDIGSHYWGHVLSNARTRNLEFNISKNYAWNLFVKQNKKCALSDLLITLDPSGKKQSASLDRIDNSKGYIPGNIQWLHKDINKMKNVHDQQYFIDLCVLISEKNKSCN